MSKHVKAFSLPTVMVISVLVSLLVLFAMSLANLESHLSFAIICTKNSRFVA